MWPWTACVGCSRTSQWQQFPFLSSSNIYCCCHPTPSWLHPQYSKPVLLYISLELIKSSLHHQGSVLYRGQEGRVKLVKKLVIGSASRTVMNMISLLITKCPSKSGLENCCHQDLQIALHSVRIGNSFYLWCYLCRGSEGCTRPLSQSTPHPA